MRMGNLTLRSQKINNLIFLQKFLHQNMDLSRLKVVDLGDNNLGKENASEICHLIELPGSKIETLILSNNHIGSSGLQHICSALVSNKTLVNLDISHNNIEDSHYKILYSLLQKNQVIRKLTYSLSNEDNIKRNELLEAYVHSGMTAEMIEQRLILEKEGAVSHHLSWKQKLCLPFWCWKSFIHDKHEAFRFKYATKELNDLEAKMNRVTFLLYFNSIVYYVIMFVCPFIFVNECGNGMSRVSHIIYGAYSLWASIMEITTVLWIQKKLKNPNLLKFNKWHLVELLMGQIARFDTYLDVCFLSLLL